MKYLLAAILGYLLGSSNMAFYLSKINKIIIAAVSTAAIIAIALFCRAAIYNTAKRVIRAVSAPALTSIFTATGCDIPTERRT